MTPPRASLANKNWQALHGKVCGALTLAAALPVRAPLHARRAAAAMQPQPAVLPRAAFARSCQGMGVSGRPLEPRARAPVPAWPLAEPALLRGIA